MGLFDGGGFKPIEVGLAPFTGGASLLGTDFIGDMFTNGAVSNAKAQREANNMTANSVSQQMSFQEKMSSTAYQRAMSDMRKAGLNPSLAFQTGGASAPQGASATYQSDRRGDIGAGLAANAKAALQMSAGLSNTNADTSVKTSQAGLNQANVAVANSAVLRNQASAAEAAQSAKLSAAQTAKANAELPAHKARSEYDRKLAPVDAIMERVGQGLGILTNSARGFFRGSMSPPTENQRLEKAGTRGIPVRTHRQKPYRRP